VNIKKLKSYRRNSGRQGQKTIRTGAGVMQAKSSKRDFQRLATTRRLCKKNR